MKTYATTVIAKTPVSTKPVSSPAEGVAVILAIVLILGYFFPAVVAMVRAHRLSASIFIVNLMLGWTLVGWVVALALAASPSRRNM